MNLNQRLLAALAAVGVPTVASIYTGKEASYITFNADTLPMHYADNRPNYLRALIQVHYFCPLDEDSMARRRAIVKGLFLAGFPYPDTIDATDRHSQHFVFETEAILDLEDL